MIDQARLRELLEKGRKVPWTEYYQRCRTNLSKTFFLFCERLLEAPPGISLSSRELMDHVTTQIKNARIKADKQRWNPEGWFGEEWTEWEKDQGRHSYFLPEYAQILRRSDSQPYDYQIIPESHQLLKSALDEVKAAAAE